MKTPPAALANRLAEVSEEVLRPDRDLRLEDVAALVGSKRATLYYYFSGRDDLVEYLMTEHMTAMADAMEAASGPRRGPVDKLRAAVAALLEFVGERPGVCAGLMTCAGASGRLSSLMTAKDAIIAEPLRRILADEPFAMDDPRDTVSGMLGAAFVATLDRWYRGEAATPEFRGSLTEQIVRGVPNARPELANGDASPCRHPGRPSR